MEEVISAVDIKYKTIIKTAPMYHSRVFNALLQNWEKMTPEQIHKLCHELHDSLHSLERSFMFFKNTDKSL